MHTAIVPEGNGHSVQFLAIEAEVSRFRRSRGQPGDRDVIDRLSIAVVYLERAPCVGEAGGQTQLIPLKVDAQQGFDKQSVHPPGGSGVPRPATPARVRGDRVNVRRDNVGLDFIDGDLLRRPAMVDGV